jgi:hypothetical protein
MPLRKSVWPGDGQRDRRREVKPQRVWTDVFEDEPPTILPEGAIAKAINGWPVGRTFRPRNGTVRFSARYPAIEGRTGYAARKVGNQIISESGDIFTAADVSNIWVWDNGLTDEMTVYVNAQTMQCRDSDLNTGTNCHIQGKLNLNQWHRGAELWVLQLGQDFYTAPRNKSAYTQVHIYGRDLPTNSISEMIEDEDDALVQNARYQYRIELTKTPIRAYPTSSPVPSVRIQSNQSQGDKNHKYHYIYSCANFDGEGNFINRETTQAGNYIVRILTETGTNQIDENRRDWAIVNSDEAVGNQTDRYGVLTGAALAAPFDAPGGWAGISDITFLLNVNALGWQEIVTDGTLVATLDELAERIQTSIRVYFPSATCRYEATAAVGPHIRITSGYVAGGTVLTAVEALNGTPSAVNLGLTAGAGAVATRPFLGIPRILRYLYLPRVQNIAGVEYQWHHNFYPIYRCLDLGPLGMSDSTRKDSTYYSHLNERGKRVVNSPDELIWNKDLRVAGAFIARRINGYIEIRAGELGGELELADQGSVMEFEDGSRTEIIQWINSKLARYVSGLDEYYYHEETPWMAACIGNGRAVRVTQTGTRITRVPVSDPTSYTAFTAADERKPIWYANGVRTFIREVINANVIDVYDSTNRAETGITYNPRYRAYCDAIPDTELHERASGWMCKNRFMREVLPSNMVAEQPGYYLMAARNGKQVRYCPLEPGYKQFVGYHNREYQTIELEDRIERLIGFTNRFSALCKGEIRTGATNNAIAITIPETYQQVFVLSGMEKVASVGLISYGSLDWIDDDLVRFITNTGELRDFNGIQFRLNSRGRADDYSEDSVQGLGRFKKALQRAYKEFNSKYARGVGFITWWQPI